MISKPFYTFALISCIWFYLIPSTFGDTVTIHQAERELGIGKYTEYLDWGLNTSQSEAYTLELLNQIPTITQPHPTESMHSSRVSIKNNTGKHLSYYLQSFTVGYTKAFLIPESGHVRTYHTGDAIPLSQRDIKLGNYKNLIPVEIPKNETVTLYLFHFNTIEGYIRFYKSSKVFEVYPILKLKDAYLKNHHEHRYIEFSMIAAMLALVLYNLIVFFKTKYTTYIYYVLNVFCFVLYYLFQSQIGFEYIWGEYPWFHFKGGIYPAICSVIFGILFFQSFIRLKDLLPWWNKALNIIGSGFILVILSLVIFQLTKNDLLGDILVQLNSTLTLLATSSILIACILAIRKGSADARYYLFTTLVLIICVILFLQLGSSGNFSKSLILIGYTSQSLLLSFGLANSINNLREEVSKQKLKQIKLKQEQAREKQRILEDQKDKLETEVIKRTSELTEANNELFSTVSKLNDANTQLADQRQILEEINRKTTASIQYAQRIQTASLPSSELIKDLAPNAFVLHLPRDIVSGDFYWFGEKEGKTVIIAADSTGHGVPGAFMSLIGIKLLDHIILEKGITDPSTILSHLDEGVEMSLNSGTSLDNHMNDGMDLAVCVIDHQHNTLYYAGAHNPVFIISKDGPKLIKADKMPIGSSKHYQHKTFTTHTYQYTSGDIFYLYTDGYYDQFGGEKGRKYYPKPFREFLETLSVHPIQEQRAKLLNEFTNWRGNYAQVDDVLVIGVSL